MVVKSATKKKLMDLGIADNYAHVLADDKKWDDVKILTSQQIAQICETDSETGDTIHTIIIGATKKGHDQSSESTGPVTNVKLKEAKKRSTIKTAVDMEIYDVESKLLSYVDPLGDEQVFKALVDAVEKSGSIRFTDRIFHDLTQAIHDRGINKLTKPQAKKVIAGFHRSAVH